MNTETNPALEGTPLYVHGHSYLAIDTFGQGPAQRYPARVARRQGMTQVNHAVGGSQMIDTAQQILLGHWSVGQVGTALLDCTLNDLIVNGYGELALRGYRNALETITAFTGLASLREESDAAISKFGAQRVNPYPYATAGQNWVVTTGQLGAASHTFYGTSLVLGLAGLTNPTGGTFEVLVDGQVHGAFSCHDQCAPSHFATPMVYRLDGLADALHNVVVRPLGNTPTGDGPFLDFIGTPSPAPAALVLVRALMVRHPAVTAEGLAAYNGIIADVAGQRPNVYVADPEPGWDPARMVGADDVHLTAEGHAHIADAVMAAMSGIPFSAGVSH